MLKLSVLFVFISTTLYSQKFNEIKGIWTIENPTFEEYKDRHQRKLQHI